MQSSRKETAVTKNNNNKKNMVAALLQIEAIISENINFLWVWKLPVKYNISWLLIDEISFKSVFIS